MSIPVVLEYDSTYKAFIENKFFINWMNIIFDKYEAEDGTISEGNALLWRENPKYLLYGLYTCGMFSSDNTYYIDLDTQLQAPIFDTIPTFYVGQPAVITVTNEYPTNTHLILVDAINCNVSISGFNLTVTPLSDGELYIAIVAQCDNYNDSNISIIGDASATTSPTDIVYNTLDFNFNAKAITKTLDVYYTTKSNITIDAETNEYIINGNSILSTPILSQSPPLDDNSNDILRYAKNIYIVEDRFTNICHPIKDISSSLLSSLDCYNKFVSKVGPFNGTPMDSAGNNHIIYGENAYGKYAKIINPGNNLEPGRVSVGFNIGLENKPEFTLNIALGEPLQSSDHVLYQVPDSGVKRGLDLNGFSFTYGSRSYQLINNIFTNTGYDKYFLTLVFKFQDYIKVYKNGVLANTVTESSTSLINAYNANNVQFIGQSEASTESGLVMIYSFDIYDRVLTDDEIYSITKIYNRINGFISTTIDVSNSKVIAIDSNNNSEIINVGTMIFEPLNNTYTFSSNSSIIPTRIYKNSTTTLNIDFGVSAVSNIEHYDVEVLNKDSIVSENAFTDVFISNVFSNQCNPYYNTSTTELGNLHLIYLTHPIPEIYDRMAGILSMYCVSDKMAYFHLIHHYSASNDSVKLAYASIYNSEINSDIKVANINDNDTFSYIGYGFPIVILGGNYLYTPFYKYPLDSNNKKILSTRTSLTAFLYDCGLLRINNYLYSFGGRYGNTMCTKIRRIPIDPITNEILDTSVIEDVTDLPTYMYPSGVTDFQSFVTYPNRFYLVGRDNLMCYYIVNSDGSLSTPIQVLNANIDNYNNTLSFNTMRFIVFKNRIFGIASYGLHTKIYSCEINKFGIPSFEWIFLKEVPFSIINASVINNRLYVMFAYKGFGDFYIPTLGYFDIDGWDSSFTSLNKNIPQSPMRLKLKYPDTQIPAGTTFSNTINSNDIGQCISEINMDIYK